MIFWTALLLGLGGSLHCVGMCGPLVMALPFTRQERRHMLWQSTIYHIGRVTTYTLMGLVFGLLGWGVVLLGYQKGLSIVLGVMLLLSVLLSISPENQLMRTTWFHTAIHHFKKRMAKAFAIKGPMSAFTIGLLNGLLPCGLVYVALAGALSSGSYWAGAAFMLVFGLGTTPLLLVLMLAGRWSPSWRRRLQRVVPVTLFVFGLILIYRGIVVDGLH